MAENNYITDNSVSQKHHMIIIQLNIFEPCLLAQKYPVEFELMGNSISNIRTTKAAKCNKHVSLHLSIYGVFSGNSDIPGCLHVIF